MIAGARLAGWELGSEPGSQRGKASGDPVCWGLYPPCSTPFRGPLGWLGQVHGCLWCPAVCSRGSESGEHVCSELVLPGGEASTLLGFRPGPRGGFPITEGLLGRGHLH